MNVWRRSGPVVVEVDGSAAGRRVLDYASQEALRAGADLVLVAPYHNHPAHSPIVPLRSPSTDAEEVLRDAAAQVKRLRNSDLVVRTISAEGSRLKVLQNAADDARVLVVGRHHDSEAPDLISAQGNLALAGRATCPVIVVPSNWKPSPAERSIIVGIDGTALSLDAVEFGFRTAADRSGDLTVVHSHRMPYRMPAATDDSTWQELAGLTVSETLAGWDEEYPNVRLTRLLTVRPVVAVLADECEHVGLVVVGAHAGPLPIGDPVTRRTIAEMTCPVAVVAHHVTPAEKARRRREIAARS